MTAPDGRAGTRGALFHVVIPLLMLAALIVALPVLGAGIAAFVTWDPQHFWPGNWNALSRAFAAAWAFCVVLFLLFSALGK